MSRLVQAPGVDESLQPTLEGKEKIERWRTAVDRVVGLERQLNSARCEMDNAKNELARWMLPKDAKNDEQFNIAVGNGFLAVSLTSGGSYVVGWRKEPTK